MTWTHAQARALCVSVEAIAPTYGCHVALTGGCLYKPEPRKDLDLLFYRIRQVEKVDVAGLFEALEVLGIRRVTQEEVWCVKAVHPLGNIDCFFPDVPRGDYPTDEAAAGKDVAF